MVQLPRPFGVVRWVDEHGGALVAFTGLLAVVVVVLRWAG